MKFGRTEMCELNQKWVFLFVKTEITQNVVSQNMKSYNASNEKTPEIMKTIKGGFHLYNVYDIIF
jgi:hypothetical protein